MLTKLKAWLHRGCRDERLLTAVRELSRDLSRVCLERDALLKQIGSPAKQLEAWRARWHPAATEESDELLNRAFAGTFGNQDGKAVIDYLIGEYYKPIQFAGATDAGKLAERNGQQQLLIDILTRYDTGMHPMAFEPERSSDDDKPMDVRA